MHCARCVYPGGTFVHSTDRSASFQTNQETSCFFSLAVTRPGIVASSTGVYSMYANPVPPGKPRRDDIQTKLSENAMIMSALQREVGG